MALSRERGQELAEKYPAEMVEMYVAGKTLRQIAWRYGRSDYLRSPHVAEGAVYCALRLLRNRLPTCKRRRLGIQHRITGASRAARIRGRQDFLIGEGMWAEENADALEAGRVKGGKRGGAIAGKKCYRNGTGIFGMDQDELTDAVRAAVRARGDDLYKGTERFTPYGRMNERKFVMTLRGDGYPWRNVARRVNKVFHHRRTDAQLKCIYNRYWTKDIRLLEL